MRIQIIGSYFERVSDILLKRGIVTENIISALNPLAMAGNANAKYLHYCDEIGNVPVALNVKKNLIQMLSHDEKKFCANEKKQAPGTEVRYKNTADYVVVCNSYIAVTLFEDGNTLYSDIWPQNKMVEELKTNKSLKIIRFPFPGGFNWKYYYDKFIDAIKAEYDADHIILVKINSAQWYMDGDEIVKFEPLAKAYKNAVEEIDDYFQERTNCYTVNALFSQIPDQKRKNAFPYEVFVSYSYKRIADEIYDIITGKTKKNVFPQYHNPTVQYLMRRFSYEIVGKVVDDLELLEKKWVVSLDKCEQGTISDDIARLKYFLDPKKNNCLSDYLNTLEILTESQIDEKIIVTALYVKYLKVDLNDLIAIFKFYCNCPNKIDFKEIVTSLLNKRDFGPIKTCFDFVEKNLSYLKEYKYISAELLKAKKKNAAYVKISDSCYIVLDPDSDEMMLQIKVEAKRVDDHIFADGGYVCGITQADHVCASWKLYIEKARRGDGARPFKILFASEDEFLESLFYIDYAGLLDNEHFILSTDCGCEIEGACARTNLDFLFKPNAKICVIANGLADQLAYYVFAEILKEKTNADVYFYDRTQNFNGREFDRFAKYDISGKLISNLVSERLLEQTYGASWNFANVLYENGLKELTMVHGGWCSAHMDKAKCSRMAINNIPSFFTTQFDSLSYYWCLIRPDEIMEYVPFKLSDYICFPDFDTEMNEKLSQKMLQSDSISIHVRRGDFVTVERADDLSFYHNAVEKILHFDQYLNKKWFIFSDDILFCKSHTSELGLDLIQDDEIIFIDHNKYENSFRDMQLMTYSKVIVGGNSGFSRLAAIYSERCEMFIYKVKQVMELFQRIGGGISGYDIDSFVQNEESKNVKLQNTSNNLKTVVSPQVKTEGTGILGNVGMAGNGLIRQVNRIASIGGSTFDYFIDKGINKINLFGNDESVALLYEQAVLKGLQVGRCLSDKEVEYNVNLLDKHLKVGDADTIASRKIKTLNINKGDNGLPTVILEKSNHSFLQPYMIEALLNYSSLMQRLFRTVFEYKKQNAPDLKIVIVQFPSLRNVKNKNDFEIALSQNIDTVNPFIESGYDEEFIRDVNWLFPEYYKGETPMLVDHASKYLNIVEGHRVTAGIPENAAHTIFTFGPSVIFGYRTDDEHTVSSCIQRELNQYYNNKSPYQLLNCSFAGGQNYIAMRRSFLAHRPQNGDVAVFFHWLDMSLLEDAFGDEFYYFDPQKNRNLFERPHEFGEYLFADSVHLMPAGNELLGKAVAKDLIESGVLKENAADKNPVGQISSKVYKEPDEPLSGQLEEYLNTIIGSRAVIGAIVMNCNPFTLGHRYLIEYASGKCDKLYVFAVEEDLSYFPFADRIELIKKGISDLKNVTVLPSGKYIISRTTFPAYFEKEAAADDAVIDASSDIEIFARHIAPRLNICVRFAGEEPLDNVTRQYNAQMKMILPRYGIHFEVIPRKEVNGEVVSASRVRRLLREKKFAEIEKLVPKTTLEYLKDRFGK